MDSEWINKLQDNPEVQRILRWHRFFELNPHICVHNEVLISDQAPTGTCTACKRRDISADIQGDIPDSEPFTALHTSTAHILTTNATFAGEQQ